MVQFSKLNTENILVFGKLFIELNFATEVATHYAEPQAARKLQAWVGSTVSEECDMEGTKEEFGDFADFLIDSKMSQGVSGSEYAGAGAPALN